MSQWTKPPEQVIADARERFRKLHEQLNRTYGRKLPDPSIDPNAFKRVLRVDSLVNSGEMRVDALKIQFESDDPKRDKPFLVPWLTISLLSGAVDMGVRNDRSKGLRYCYNVRHLSDPRDKDKGLILEAAIAMLRRDGFVWAAALLDEIVELKKGLGWLIFNRAVGQPLVDLYQAAPEYDRNPWINEGKMEPGQPYAFALMQSKGKLEVKLARFTGYTDSKFPDEPPVAETQEPNLRFCLTPNGAVDRLKHNHTSCHINRGLGVPRHAKAFPVTEALYELAQTCVTPKFDHPATDVPIPMPAWTLPLDNVADCLARLSDQKHAIDPDQTLEALAFLATHRDQLTERLHFEFSSEPDESFDEAAKKNWQTVIDNSQSSCHCGTIRTFVSVDPETGFEPSCEGMALGSNQIAYLIPKDGTRDDALVTMQLLHVEDAEPLLVCHGYPFSDTVKMLPLLGHPAVTLSQLSKLAREKPKPRVSLDGRDVCELEIVAIDRQPIWIFPDVSLRVEVDKMKLP